MGRAALPGSTFWNRIWPRPVREVYGSWNRIPGPKSGVSGFRRFSRFTWFPKWGSAFWQRNSYCFFNIFREGACVPVPLFGTASGPPVGPHGVPFSAPSADHLKSGAEPCRRRSVERRAPHNPPRPPIFVVRLPPDPHFWVPGVAVPKSGVRQSTTQNQLIFETF